MARIREVGQTLEMAEAGDGAQARRVANHAVWKRDGGAWPRCTASHVWTPMHELGSRALSTASHPVPDCATWPVECDPSTSGISFSLHVYVGFVGVVGTKPVKRGCRRRDAVVQLVSQRLVERRVVRGEATDARWAVSTTRPNATSQQGSRTASRWVWSSRDSTRCPIQHRRQSGAAQCPLGSDAVRPFPATSL